MIIDHTYSSIVLYFCIPYYILIINNEFLETSIYISLPLISDSDHIHGKLIYAEIPVGPGRDKMAHKAYCKI